MASKQDVEDFLRQLHDKMLVYEVAFRPRGKNLNALAELEIIPIERIEHIKKLKV